MVCALPPRALFCGYFFVGVLTFVGGVLQTKARLCQHEPLQSVHRFSSSSLDAHLRLL